MVTASIIITTYNRPELFKRALKSAQNQTYDNYEIIVVDDCSKEYYLSNLEDNHIRNIRHQENKGLSAARNTGIKAAKGKYIVCLDDDNELHHEFLREAIRRIGKADAVTVGRRIKYKKFSDYALPDISLFTAIDWGWLIKRSVFDDIQYDEELRANEDTDFGIQFFKKYRAVTLSMILAIAYDTENSLSFPDARELKGMDDFYKKNRIHYLGHPNELRCLYRTMGRKLYRGGYKLEGLGWFYKSFKAKPCLNSLLNLVFILFGWKIYDIFMSVTEYYGSKIHKGI